LELITPFKEKLQYIDEVAQCKYIFLNKIDDRVSQIEEYCRIESEQPESKKVNKFTILE
jgi:hypothetical protein